MVVLICVIVFADKELEKFDSSFGHCENYSMADALWACSNIFANWYVLYIHSPSVLKFD